MEPRTSQAQSKQGLKVVKMEKNSMMGTGANGEGDFEDKEAIMFDEDLQEGDGHFSKGWTVIMNHILNPYAPKSLTFKNFQK